MGINIFVVINQIIKQKSKIYNQCMYTPFIIKKFYFFSSQSIRMSGNSINFDNKKIKKVTSTTTKTKKYLIQMILMLIKYQSLKKNNMANIIHLNTLLGIMIMMLLDHYV